MKYSLYFILYFGLPHVNWFTEKLGENADIVPLGIANIILLLACFLWFSCKRKDGQLTNPIKSYNYFIWCTVICVGVAIIMQYEPLGLTLTLAKRQITLMLLYYIPLATIESDEEFKKIFVIMLLVNALIGLEVVRSGVLEGSNFHDGKR